MRRNSDASLRELERAYAAQPGDKTVAQRFTAALRRVGREQDAIAVEIATRINAGDLDPEVARVVAAFPAGLEGRLSEVEGLLTALRSVIAPATSDDVAAMLDLNESARNEEGWSITDAEPPEHTPYEIQILQDYQSGVDLARAYRSETGLRQRETGEVDTVGDTAAWWRVRKNAYAGKRRHLATLAFLLLNESADEYWNILRAWSGTRPAWMDTEWPERELSLVKAVILGEPYSPEDVVPGSFQCDKCGSYGLPSGESCGECGEPFCGHCEGVTHPGMHECGDVVENPTYYHGTRDEHMDSIMKKGLSYPFLSSEESQARCWGRSYSNEQGRDVRVLEVEIDDEDRVVPDFNLMNEDDRRLALGVEPGEYFDVRSEFLRGDDNLVKAGRRFGSNSVDDRECGGEASIYLGTVPPEKLHEVTRRNGSRKGMEARTGRSRNPRTRRNPLVDSDVLAQRLVDAGFAATEIPLSEVRLSTADRGHPVVDEPDRYRFFLIREFPVQAFGLKLKDLMGGSDPGHEKWRHDKIVDLLREEPAWPALVAADGVLVDGFHRIAANRTLRRKTMPVVVAVERSGQSHWDEDWLFANEDVRHSPAKSRPRITECSCGCDGYIDEHDDRGWGPWSCPFCGEDSDTDYQKPCSDCANSDPETRSNPGQHFRVRSTRQGLDLIRHPAIVENFAKALRWRPKNKLAVLVPCAGTKPFPEAPSHRDGYLAALDGKKADLWVVSEPLGVVPYDFSTTWPNDAYDFPPKFLREEAWDALVERVVEWLEKVAPKYRKVFVALPGHHERLLRAALELHNPGNLKDSTHSQCLGSGACPSGHGRATSKKYRRYLEAVVRNPRVEHVLMSDLWPSVKDTFWEVGSNCVTVRVCEIINDQSMAKIGEELAGEFSEEEISDFWEAVTEHDASIAHWVGVLEPYIGRETEIPSEWAVTLVSRSPIEVSDGFHRTAAAHALGLGSLPVVMAAIDSTEVVKNPRRNTDTDLRNPEVRSSSILASRILSGDFDPFTETSEVVIDFDIEPTPILYNVVSKRPGEGLGWVALLGFLDAVRSRGKDSFYATDTTGPGAHMIAKAVEAGLIEPRGRSGINWFSYAIVGEPGLKLQELARKRSASGMWKRRNSNPEPWRQS